MKMFFSKLAALVLPAPDDAAAARRAFFALVLATFGSWIVLALFTFADGWTQLAYFLWASCVVNVPLEKLLAGSTGLLLLPIIFLLVAAWYVGCFWRRRFKKLSRAACARLGAVLLLCVAALVWSRHASWSLALVLWIMPFAVYRREWPLVLCRNLCWTPGLALVLKAVNNLAATVFCLLFYTTPPEFLVTRPWPKELLAILVPLSTVLWFVGWWLTAKIAASATGQPTRRIFTRPATVVIALSFAAYFVSLFIAYRERGVSDAAVARLNERLGAPATVRTLRDRYYAGRRVDRAFWDAAKSLDPDDSFEAPDQERFRDPEKAELAPEELKKWRSTFESSREIVRLEELFSAPVPADARDYEGRFIAELQLRELQPCRNLYRAESWRVRFAIADGDFKTALAALRRMDNARECPAHDDFLIAGLVLAACEKLRCDAIERLLAAKLLDDTEKARLRADLEQSERLLTSFHKKSLLAETVGLLETCGLVANGGTFELDEKRADVEALYPYRWFFPPLWYVFSANRGEVARRFAVDKLSQLPDTSVPDVRKLLVNVLTPAGRKAGERFDTAAARCRALREKLAAE